MFALVTGGAGFIGSHIAATLVKRGYGVRIFDNLSSGRRANFAAIAQHVEFTQGDIRDSATLKAAAQGCEVIFHQAAIVSVPYSVLHPDETLDANIRGTLNVLEAARATQARRVVFASSAAVYGDEPTLPKSERMQAEPISPYGLEKLTGEHYLRVYSKLHGLETVALRYFNVFGPRQDPSSPYSGVISKFVDRAIAGARPTLFGDGSASRDFVYVDNVADANVRAALSERASGQVFNVGCGMATRLSELLTMLSKIVGREVVPVHEGIRNGDIASSVADISRARAVLGYEPRVGVEDGLARLVAHVMAEPPA